MGVRFDCRPSMIGPRGTSAPKGEPLRARTCSCDDFQVLDLDGLCTNCGYWPKETVDETWRRQAKATGWHGPVSSLDQYRRLLYERQFGTVA